jgi:hypothetical protein
LKLEDRALAVSTEREDAEALVFILFLGPEPTAKQDKPANNKRKQPTICLFMPHYPPPNHIDNQLLRLLPTAAGALQLVHGDSRARNSNIFPIRTLSTTFWVMD